MQARLKLQFLAIVYKMCSLLYCEETEQESSKLQRQQTQNFALAKFQTSSRLLVALTACRMRSETECDTGGRREQFR